MSTELPRYDALSEGELGRLHAAAVGRTLYGTQAEVNDALRRLDGIERALYGRRKARVEDIAFDHGWQIHYFRRFSAMYTQGARRFYAVFNPLGMVSYLDTDATGPREPQHGPDLTDQLLEALKG
jgi:hypothetical protein